MKFTKEEISLCKQIAGRYRKDIEYGDWYIEPGTQKGVLLWDYEDTPYFVGDQCSDTVPLWTISDCLEFFINSEIIRSWEAYEANDIEPEEVDRGDYFGCNISYIRYVDKSEKGDMKQPVIDLMQLRGKTPLEALLKAVLAALEEK